MILLGIFIYRAHVIASPRHHMAVSRFVQQLALRIACVVRIQPPVLIKPFDLRVKAFFSYTPAKDFMR
jgi:hypothetical protein